MSGSGKSGSSSGKGSSNGNSNGRDTAITIKFIGNNVSAGSRSLSIWPPTPAMLERMEYRVLFSREGKVISSSSSRGGSSVSASVAAGVWDITVEAKYEGSAYGKGVAYNQEIKAGVKNEVDLLMYPDNSGSGGTGGNGGTSTPSSSDKTITAFNIPGATNTSITGNTIIITMPASAALTSLTPTITHTGASISPASNTAQNFIDYSSYTVTAQDGSTQSYTVIVGYSLNNAANQTINGSRYIATSLNLSATTAGQSGLVIAAGATVEIYIPAGVILNVSGGNGAGTIGGGAGIRLPESSTLTLRGGGSLNAYGGNAAAGTVGGAGIQGQVGSDAQAGSGGTGGEGGGGAGAGIGTNGGSGAETGGTGGSGGYVSGNLATNGTAVAGSVGISGNTSAIMGTLYVLDTITVTGLGGTGNSGTGGGGGAATTQPSMGTADGRNYAAGNGGGGGGGGGGGSGAGIGSGGGGGGSGGGGGGGNAVSSTTQFIYSHGGGGNGGSGGIGLNTIGTTGTTGGQSTATAGANFALRNPGAGGDAGALGGSGGSGGGMGDNGTVYKAAGATVHNFAGTVINY